MAAHKDFALTMLIMGLLLALAVGLLVLRDRRSLRPGISSAERRRVIGRNTAQTVHWWHLAILAVIINVLVLELGRRHQLPLALLAEAAVTAFLVFRYHRKRTEESSKLDHRYNDSTPIN
jgi:hypothetical protein